MVLLRWIAVYVFAVMVVVLGVATGALHNVSQKSKSELAAVRKQAETAERTLTQHTTVIESVERSLEDLRRKLVDEGVARASAEAALHGLQQALEQERRAKVNAELQQREMAATLEAERRLREAAEAAQQSAGAELAALRARQNADRRGSQTEPSAAGAAPADPATPETGKSLIAKPQTGGSPAESTEKTADKASDPEPAAPLFKAAGETPPAETVTPPAEAPPKDKPRPVKQVKKAPAKPPESDSWFFGP